ncbi:DUF6612 family protein [Clostridium sp. MD294]|uniref:DUF6612 family protein n=1 Tax=Clostridium sp. MD294 TaxID=97138 RepID=UPI0002CA531E|nr:DUF6612 family protein [Clostridium sp. MD294]NDO46648.1 hypothetical protein [Clostridium sp. MD294]USF28919.1 hypothetical protein C820_000299 [Clostridium sp. MD294]
MKFYNKLIYFAMAIVMMCSMAACSGGNGDNEGGEVSQQESAALTPEEIVKAAEEKMQEATSVESNMTMDMVMTAEGQTVNMKTNMDMISFTEPMKLKMDMAIDMGEQLGGTQMMQFYADETDGNMTMYINMMDTWYKQVVSEEQLAQYNTKENLSTYLDSSTNVTEVATEQVNGEDATKYDGVITGSQISEVLKASGALDDLEPMFAGTDLDASTLYEDLPDIKMSIWINAEQYPVKYEMDMTTMMQGLMDKVIAISQQEQQDLSIPFTVDTMKISMTNKNFNNAADFEIPEEAKNAIQMQ